PRAAVSVGVRGVGAARPRHAAYVVADAAAGQPQADEMIGVLARPQRSAGDHELERGPWRIEPVTCAIEQRHVAVAVGRGGLAARTLSLVRPRVAGGGQQLTAGA